VISEIDFSIVFSSFATVFHGFHSFHNFLDFSLSVKLIDILVSHKSFGNQSSFHEMLRFFAPRVSLIANHFICFIEFEFTIETHRVRNIFTFFIAIKCDFCDCWNNLIIRFLFNFVTFIDCFWIAFVIETFRFFYILWLFISINCFFAKCQIHWWHLFPV
jgi:hypothetical protein